MAGESGVQAKYTFEAAADLSTKQYHGMRISGANLCNQASLVTDNDNFGILQNKPESGQAATVAYFGPTVAVAGAAITLPAFVSFNSSGRMITVTSGDMCHGRAMNTAGADGDEITVILMPAIRWSGAP